jgi:Leucine-rich repeat (LRR) protein
MSFHNASLGSLWGNSQPIDDRLVQAFVSKLNSWSSRGNIGEAKRRIIACFGQPGNNHLNLSGLGLSTLPDVIGQLTYLKILNIENNELESLPPNIKNLGFLEVLDCGRNHLTSLPNEIKDLSCLQTLYCNQNQLTSLPYGIKYLTCLQILDFANNKLSQLPDEIKNLIHLQKLNCSNNKIESLPYVIKYLSFLLVFDCSNNKLSKLPYEIKELENLQELNFSGNQIKSLPYEIRELKNLRELNGENNALSSLPDISTLKNTRLRFCGNNIPEVPLSLRGLNIEIGQRRPVEPAREAPAMHPLSIEDNARRVRMESSDRVYAGIAQTQAEIDRIMSDHNAHMVRINAGMQNPRGQAQRFDRSGSVQPASNTLNPQNVFSQPSPLSLSNQSSPFSLFNNSPLSLGNQSSPISLGNKPSSLSLGNQPSPLSLGNKPSSLSLGNQPSSLSLGNKPSSLSLGNQPSPLSLGNQPSSLSLSNQSSPLSLSNNSPFFLGNHFERFKHALPESKRELKQLEIPALRKYVALWNKLLSWLDKLSLSADFKNPNTCSLTAERVLLIVQMAEQNEAFRPLFADTLEAASEENVDKAPHHLASLEIQRIIMDSNAQSLGQVLKVFEGAFAAELLDAWAHEFVNTRSIPFSEHVEVCLGLQLKFKPKFQLPIGVEGNLSCHQLQNSDLARAEEAVRQGLKDRAKFSDFLAKQKVWTERLAKEFDVERRGLLEPMEDRLSRQANVVHHVAVIELYWGERLRIIADMKSMENRWYHTKTREVLGLSAPSQVRLPTETVITVKCKDLPLGKKLFIRGNKAGLSWNQGVELTRVDWETFEYKTRVPFSEELQYKLLISDDTNKWEAGDNHKVTQGSRLERSHTFSKEALPPQTKTTLTVDLFLPVETLCLCGSGPLGNWDKMVPMESVRNDKRKWYITFDGKFPDFEYKVCLSNGDMETRDSNRVAKCGTHSAMESVYYSSVFGLL